MTISNIFNGIGNHPDDLAEVQILGHYRISVRFNDGTSGTVNLAPVRQSPDAGVFAELRDQTVFQAVSVSLGAVDWSGGIDLAPDMMYLALVANGEWTPA